MTNEGNDAWCVVELSIRRLRVDRAESKRPGVDYDDDQMALGIEALLRAHAVTFAEQLWVKFPHDLDDSEDEEELLEAHARRIDYLGHAPPTAVAHAGGVATLEGFALYFRVWPRAGVEALSAADAVRRAIRVELWPEVAPKGWNEPLFAQTTILEHALSVAEGLPLTLAPRDHQEGWPAR